MFSDLAIDSVIFMFSHIIFIIIAWKSLEAVHIEKIFKQNRVVESRIFFIMLSIVIGTTVSNFFIDFIRWSRQLQHLFG
ncbi:DUF1146 family protein [Tenuibacillus multivorans]|uniref:Conserved hypothetical integral membrane protein n=1 Tax=Tenuibacillus multivorans TaxID=237069 RepID=A0A1G9X3A5_9BACI|nr:DUF1146 family protein [Tenuibacillus multivorans]GEL77244.1 hypothetical protein TMU01_14790 [Tenuibacillus multivorans]SDM91229.1 conserved hypothetical integral membrane protein [Tenuibacillus multivorans]